MSTLPSVVSEATLSQVLASSQPKDPCTQVVQLPSDLKNVDLFEFALNVLLEIMCIKTDDFKNVDLSSMTNVFKEYSPYLASIGFILHVEEYSRMNPEHTDQINNHYCRICLRRIEENLFTVLRTNKSFNFLMGGNYINVDLDQIELNKFYAIFYSKNNVTIKISFEQCDHQSHKDTLKEIKRQIKEREIIIDDNNESNNQSFNPDDEINALAESIALNDNNESNDFFQDDEINTLSESIALNDVTAESDDES
jgi:hypothetical protein